MLEEYLNKIINGDCLEVLHKLPDSCIDVVVTSPLYNLKNSTGKSIEWQTPRAKMYGAKIYSNYAIDLGLLAKNDASVYLTSEGFKFVIQMQLHKSLKLMNYLNIN